MKKLVYISMIFAFFLAIQSCEKSQVQKVDMDDPFALADEDYNYNMRGGGDDDLLDDPTITDPDDDDDLDDEDDDIITDPDDDEDMDDDGK